MLRLIAALGLFLTLSLGSTFDAHAQQNDDADAPASAPNEGAAPEVQAQTTDSAADAETEALVDVEAESQTEAESEPESTFFDANHRQRIYDEAHLSHTRAALYTLAFPGLGNFYVEQYALGTVAMALMVFAGLFIAYGLSFSRNDLAGLGAGVAGLAYVGGLVTSYQGVRRYNLRLQQSLQLDRAAAGMPAAPRTFGLSLSVSF